MDSIKKSAGALEARLGGLIEGKALFGENREAGTPAPENERKGGLGLLKHCGLCEKSFGVTTKARTCHTCSSDFCTECVVTTCSRCQEASATANQQANSDFELLWKQTQVRLAEIPKLQEEVKQLQEAVEEAKERAEKEASRAAASESELSQLRADLADAHAALEAEKAEAEASKASFESEMTEYKSKADEDRQALQGKLSELTEQLLNSMIEPVRREG